MGCAIGVVLRGEIGLLLALVWLALRPHGRGPASRRLWFWSAIAGLGVAGNFVLYFVSIAQASVAVAAALMYCAPVFVYLVSFARKLESPTKLKWGAIVVVMLGIVLLPQIYDIGGSGVTPIGAVAGLLAGMSYAIFIFGFKYAVPHGSPQAIISIAFAVVATTLIGPSDVHQTVAATSTPDDDSYREKK